MSVKNQFALMAKSVVTSSDPLSAHVLRDLERMEQELAQVLMYPTNTLTYDADT